ncbi:hypothetical protein HR060_04420 [Catenovulum sp. SM1970]|uniref:hypothetical protein n=1 Tax=Marinifaba aquimaris TaxID=2741323 RepID=UPI001572B3C4|nr:hypothetical protein [Marinifaba aquimaris]NTS76106.1 hypothetical protein [Marinifaba aquimaris]
MQLVFVCLTFIFLALIALIAKTTGMAMGSFTTLLIAMACYILFCLYLKTQNKSLAQSS